MEQNYRWTEGKLCRSIALCFKMGTVEGYWYFKSAKRVGDVQPSFIPPSNIPTSFYKPLLSHTSLEDKEHLSFTYTLLVPALYAFLMPLTHQSAVRRRQYIIKADNSLRLINPEFGDAGTYTCVATNIHGNDSRSTTLSIAQKPHILSTTEAYEDFSADLVEVTVGSSIRCRLGSTVKISCPTEGEGSFRTQF